MCVTTLIVPKVRRQMFTAFVCDFGECRGCRQFQYNRGKRGGGPGNKICHCKVALLKSCLCNDLSIQEKKEKPSREDYKILNRCVLFYKVAELLADSKRNLTKHKRFHLLFDYRDVCKVCSELVILASFL